MAGDSGIATGAVLPGLPGRGCLERPELSDELIDELLGDRQSAQEIAGPHGLLGELTRRLLERPLEAEITEHLGYPSGGAPRGGAGNSRNGLERVRARRGHAIAIVAVARKMCTLFWRLLTTGEDYAYTMPTATAKKLRTIELKAGVPKPPRDGHRPAHNREERRQLERQTAEHAQAAYQRTVADWHHQQQQRKATKRTAAPDDHRLESGETVEVGASVAPGRASKTPSKGKAARQTTSP